MTLGRGELQGLAGKAPDCGSVEEEWIVHPPPSHPAQYLGEFSCEACKEWKCQLWKKCTSTKIFPFFENLRVAIQLAKRYSRKYLQSAHIPQLQEPPEIPNCYIARYMMRICNLSTPFVNE